MSLKSKDKRTFKGSVKNCLDGISYVTKSEKNFKREIGEVTEFYVTEDNEAKYNTIYKKTTTGVITKKSPSKNLIDYISGQGVTLPPIEATSEEEGMPAPKTEKEIEILNV